jgi:hypothetical protein
MREDIVGMLKNAIDHGGNPMRVAQSLINSGYSMKDVREAFDYVISTNPQLSQQQTSPNQSSQTQDQQQRNSQQTSIQQPSQKPPAQQNTQQRSQNNIQITPPTTLYRPPITPSAQISQLKPLKQLPSQKTNPVGTGKIAVMVIILMLLVISLITVIIFKEKVLDFLRL